MLFIMRKVSFTLLCIVISFTAFGQSSVIIEQKPSIAYIEYGEQVQHLNFDFKISNVSNDTLTLTKIAVSVTGSDGQLVFQRFLDNNGTAPSIELIPNRIFAGASTHLVFNPFTDFDKNIRLSQLSYDFTFTDPSNKEHVFTTGVKPQQYDQNLKFAFPLKGRVLVYDAHDFFAHHRRFDFEFPFIKEVGLSTNFMRYAYDFVLLNEQNKQYSADGKKEEDYIGFAKPVYAVAGGKIIYAVGQHPDDKNFDVSKLVNNPLELYGNCIAIQHENGSVSIYGHLKNNSLKVKVGDEVKGEQEIAQIGVSGSSFFPHLHFEVRTDIKNSAEGIPSYFSNVLSINGKVMEPIRSGLVETGTIIQTK